MINHRSHSPAQCLVSFYRRVQDFFVLLFLMLSTKADLGHTQCEDAADDDGGADDVTGRWKDVQHEQL